MTIDERITAELKRHVPHVDEREAWERIQSRAPARQRSRAVRMVTVPVAAVGLLLVGSVLVSTLSSGPAPVGRPEPTTPILWPHSTLEEAEEAQRLADAGDPEYTWQLEPALEANLDRSDYVGVPQIFARFLQEELGWEEFLRIVGAVYGPGTIDVRFVRCAPGATNSFYPDDAQAGGCAPTIDDFHYETVEVRVTQPVRQGPTGIWVVTVWETVEPIQQLMPPNDAEATAIVEAFLQARIDGQGAEQYFGGGDGTAPLLYATSTEAPFERYELDLVAGASWPDGGMRFDAWLYAENDQTVVEQSFTVERDATGALGLEVSAETFENGQASIRHAILGGEVTFDSEDPWESWMIGDGSSFGTNGEPADAKINTLDHEGFLYVLADPVPVDGCEEGPASADAQSLAQSILSNDDFAATSPVATTVGGAPALRMDLVKPAGAPCTELPRSYLASDWFEAGERIRLYLVDLPDELSATVLAITIGAQESHFEEVIDQAAPILESFEFHASS